jgi:hypothetical protein
VAENGELLVYNGSLLMEDCPFTEGLHMMIYLLHKIVISGNFKITRRCVKERGANWKKMMNIIELNDGFQWFSMV